MLVVPGGGIGRDDIDAAAPGLWRYRAAFALDIPEPISLGEGRTPLVSLEWADPVPDAGRRNAGQGDAGRRDAGRGDAGRRDPGRHDTGRGGTGPDAAELDESERDETGPGGAEMLFKLEWFSPTGSFKDRGAAVMLSVLRQQGVDAVLEDSSGNGGAAVAAYAAAGGLAATVFAPASTSPAKLVQARAYGAEVRLVEGPREASQSAAVATFEAGEGFYASHNWQAFFLEGTKTLAYELWEDLGFRAPDHVVLPVGAGSSLLGCAIGFGELLRAGAIGSLPRLWAAQPLHCSPVDAAFGAGGGAARTRPVLPTVAEGTAIRDPLRLPEMLAALRASGGGTVAIPEPEILAAHARLARAGLYAEPTSATAAAAALRLRERGEIRAGQTAVVLLTGSGLKSPRA